MTESSAPLDDQVLAVRDFNRFYTRQIGLLEEGMLKSKFSLTEVRVLYELANRNGLTATQLGHELGLDAGYLSRILGKFEKRGMLARTPSATDARRSEITLTAAGHTAYEPLNIESHSHIKALLEPLATRDRTELVDAMNSIRTLLDDREPAKVPYILRPHQPGDMGWVVHRQAMLYSREYGWDDSFEALVAEIASDFLKTFDPKRERCWIAEKDGMIVGSVFVVRQSDEIAKLRMLYVDEAARGLGIGGRLVDECIRFARGRGYRTLTLWTNDILTSARRIYEAAGFTLVSEQKHHSFGKDLVGQTWDLSL